MRSNQTKKIIYGLVIVLLFGAMFPYGAWLAEEKKRKDLGEAAIGQIDTGQSSRRASAASRSGSSIR